MLELINPATFNYALSDIEETDQELILKTDLPGIDKDSVEIKVNNNFLTLQAKKKEPKGKFIRAERLFGTFKRSFKLPSFIDTAEIAATYEDGVLEVKIPKKSDSKARIIKLT